MTVDCVNTSVTHSDKTYGLLNGCYTVTAPVPGENGVYGCAIEIDGQKYVDHYSGETDINCAHNLVTVGTQSQYVYVYLKAVETDTGYQWIIDEEKGSSASVTFEAVCSVTPPTGEPNAPDDSTIKSLLKNKVFVFCQTARTHPERAFDLLEGSYTLPEAGVVSDGNGGYTYTITVLPDKYVNAYDNAFPSLYHVLLPKTQPATVTLTWGDSTEQWKAPTGDMLVKFYVMCPSRKPTEDEIVSGKHGVTIKCTNTGAEHAPETYTLTKESITSIAEPTYNSKAEKFSCMVTVSSTSYVHQYLDGKHTPDNKTATIELLWYNGAWNWPSNEDGSAYSITFEVTCKTVTPSGPEKPTENELANIKMVTVDCINKNVNHPDEDYGLIEGSYSGPTDPAADENGVYHCYIDVNGEKYVAEYSKKHGDHIYTYADTAIQRIFLTATKTDNGYVWSADNKIVFQAMCETKVVPPTPPTDEDLKNLDVPSVDVICVTKGQPHSASYGLIKDSYVIGEVTSDGNGDYTCDITVHAEKYVLESNRLYGVHALEERESNTKILTLKYEKGKWGTGREHVTFNVECVEFVPTDADLAGIRVFVQCTNSSATHGDKRKEYGLIDGYYFVKTPTFDKDSHVYRCTVNVNGDSYVEQYGKDVGNVEHTWAPVDTGVKYAYLIATWTDDGYVWSLDKEWGYTVEFEAWCKTAQTFTVIYKDGVAGKAFQDQSYTVPSGSATPAFNGTPYLAGYVFTGWTPDVAATVTANATYIASWKLDTNNNGKPDDEEERYTVTYADGAGGKAFADQVYTGLLSGTSTPKFNGSPVRAGYYFTGWSPKLSATVTGNVTYTATWTKAYGGLDNVPKTGDNGLTLALSALLLFSFCGATACVVSTKKRG